jgi:DNA-directed RNA polymerase subunit RPC12/RpoP
MENKGNQWLDKVKTYHKCPYCNIGEFSYRIQRPAYVKLIFGEKMRRYQCDNCRRKVYLKTDS